MPILSLNEFKSSDARFFKGTWVVEYHDKTHLRGETYLCLGKVKIEECTSNGSCFFSFYPQSSKQLKKCINNAWECQNPKPDAEKMAKTILDQLGESMVRLGLLQPNFEIENCKFITERKFAIVVLDTNALRDGAVRHLQGTIPHNADVDYYSYCHTDGNWRKGCKYNK